MIEPGGALVCYFLLRKTALVQRLGHQAKGLFRMTTIDSGSATRAPLIQRIKNLLLEPRSEWPRIAAEPETPWRD